MQEPIRPSPEVRPSSSGSSGSSGSAPQGSAAPSSGTQPQPYSCRRGESLEVHGEVDPLPSGKTALVTGAAKRIGRAIALTLAEAGANVAITYLGSQPEAEDTVRDLARVRCGRAGGADATWAIP